MDRAEQEQILDMLRQGTRMAVDRLEWVSDELLGLVDQTNNEQVQETLGKCAEIVTAARQQRQAFLEWLQKGAGPAADSVREKRHELAGLVDAEDADDLEGVLEQATAVMRSLVKMVNGK